MAWDDPIVGGLVVHAACAVCETSTIKDNYNVCGVRRIRLSPARSCGRQLCRGCVATCALCDTRLCRQCAESHACDRGMLSGSSDGEPSVGKDVCAICRKAKSTPLPV